MRALVTEHTEIGYKCIVNNLHRGMLYSNELFSPVEVEEFRSEGHNAIGCYNYLFLSVKMSDSLFEITFAATEQARYQFRVAAVANGNTVA